MIKITFEINGEQTDVIELSDSKVDNLMTGFADRQQDRFCREVTAIATRTVITDFR